MDPRGRTRAHERRVTEPFQRIPWRTGFARARHTRPAVGSAALVLVARGRLGPTGDDDRPACCHSPAATHRLDDGDAPGPPPAVPGDRELGHDPVDPVLLAPSARIESCSSYQVSRLGGSKSLSGSCAAARPSVPGLAEPVVDEFLPCSRISQTSKMRNTPPSWSKPAVWISHRRLLTKRESPKLSGYFRSPSGRAFSGVIACHRPPAKAAGGRSAAPVSMRCWAMRGERVVSRAIPRIALSS